MQGNVMQPGRVGLKFTALYMYTTTANDMDRMCYMRAGVSKTLKSHL